MVFSSMYRLRSLNRRNRRPGRQHRLSKFRRKNAAELQLQLPHICRMETRPANTEGNGEIRQRELVKNALRMRPTAF